jgi:ABC-type branched-subunit amino acid transport system ATPase component
MIGAGEILRAEAVEAAYGDAVILHGVTVRVAAGALVAVIGPNGSGKSTLLKTIAGLVRHRGGRSWVRRRDGTPLDITAVRPYALAALGVGYVPQVANVFADMTVMENLQLGALPLRGGARDHVRRRMEAVLAQFPIVRERLATRAGTLSGGQRQMLALARALIPDPRLLMLDEPSAGIQPDLVDQIFAKIRELCASGLSVLLVEQKARQALELSDYAYVLEMGRNRHEGTGPALAADPAVIELYLGAGRSADIAAAEASP